MRNRHKSLERLLEVKTQLHQLEEARLAAIKRRRQEAEDEKKAMFDLIGDDAKTDSLILGLACRHITGVARRERDLGAEEDAQKKAVLTRSLQKKTLEKFVREAGLAAERDAERKTLLDLAEKIAGKPPTSLG